MRTERHARARGFTFIEMMVVVAIIAVVVAFTVPRMVDARKYAAEASAVASLQAIHAAETIFRDRDLDGDAVPDYGTLDELVAARLLADEFASPSTRSGYRFEGEFGEFHWFVIARPVLPGESGDQAFRVDETGVVRFTADGSAPTRDSPPIGGGVPVTGASRG